MSFDWCGGEMRFDNNDKWNGIELGVYIHFVYCNNANMGNGWRGRKFGSI